jgi:hypothetical protein
MKGNRPRPRGGDDRSDPERAAVLPQNRNLGLVGRAQPRKNGDELDRLLGYCGLAAQRLPRVLRPLGVGMCPGSSVLRSVSLSIRAIESASVVPCSPLHCQRPFLVGIEGQSIIPDWSPSRVA